MNPQSSYRQIIRSTAIMGGASIVNIVVGLVRMKVVAVVLGPAGMGLYGLLQQLMNTGSTVAGLGVSTAGTRQIAEAAGKDDHGAVADARRALNLATLLLAVSGGLSLWLLRKPLASLVFDDPEKAPLVGWLAVGVFLFIIANSQIATLNGLRRIGELGRITAYTALLSTAIGIPALLIWKERAILVLVIAAPLASFICSHFYMARLPRVSSITMHRAAIFAQWGTLLRLGVTFMVAAALTTIGQLVVRALVQKDLGSDSLGCFTAAWTISMTYIGMILAAMGTDYYPRLTSIIHDHDAVNALVNQQTEVALLISGPIFIAMLSLMPWVVQILYSTKFEAAVEVLRWQILGDILKIMSWPLGFIMLASAAGRTFVATDGVAIGVFVLLTWILLPTLGLVATGISFFVMYTIYLPLVYFLARHRTGFRWSSSVRKIVASVIISAVFVSLVSFYSVNMALYSGLPMSVLLSILSVQSLVNARRRG